MIRFRIPTEIGQRFALALAMFALAIPTIVHAQDPGADEVRLPCQGTDVGPERSQANNPMPAVSHSFLHERGMNIQTLLPTYHLLFVLGGKAGGEPAAMVVTSTAASVVKAGKGNPQPLATMAVLSTGDELVTTDKGGVLVVFFADGHKELVKPGTRVTVAAKGCVPVLNVTRVPGAQLSQQNVASLRELSLGARAGVLVARSIVVTKPARAQPMRWEAILTDQPPFVWEDKAKVEGYLVKVFADEKPARLLWQAKTKTPRLAYPTKEKPLSPGKSYRWQVFAVPTDDEAAPLVDHQFAIMPLAQQRALTDLKPLIESGKVEDLLLVARLHETYEAHAKALYLYEQLIKLRPQEADFYSRLSNLYELAGRVEEAQATRDRAKKFLDAKKVK